MLHLQTCFSLANLNAGINIFVDTHRGLNTHIHKRRCDRVHTQILLHTPTQIEIGIANNIAAVVPP